MYWLYALYFVYLNCLSPSKYFRVDATPLTLTEHAFYFEEWEFVNQTWKKSLSKLLTQYASLKRKFNLHACVWIESLLRMYALFKFYKYLTGYLYIQNFLILSHVI